jgi:hypothetical protein
MYWQWELLYPEACCLMHMARLNTRVLPLSQSFFRLVQIQGGSGATGTDSQLTRLAFPVFLVRLSNALEKALMSLAKGTVRGAVAASAT